MHRTRHVDIHTVCNIVDQIMWQDETAHKMMPPKEITCNQVLNIIDS